MLKKSLLALAISASVVGCGSSDKPKEEVTIVDPPVSVVNTLVSGKAIKGTLINAIVNVYQLQGNELTLLTEDSLENVAIRTDEKGQYQFNLTKPIEGIVKVEITVSQDTANPTYMICDAVEGCDDVAFNEQINLTDKDPEFSLTSMSVLPENAHSHTNTVNVSSLSHIATQILEHNGSLSAEALHETSSKIANMFGINGGLTDLDIIQIEEVSELSSELDYAVLRYALINAGVAAALFEHSENNSKLSEKFVQAISDLVSADGAMLVSQDQDQDFELAINDILLGAKTAALKLASELSSQGNPANLTLIDFLNQQATNFSNEMIVKQSQANSDGRVIASESQATEGDSIAKAAAMVDDVRVFANLFDVTKVQGQDFQQEGDKFVMLLEDAGTMVQEQVESFELLGSVVQAVMEINEQLENQSITGTVFDLGPWLPAGGTGSLTFDPENYVFDVNANADDETLHLKLSLTHSEDKKVYTLALNGLLENDAVKVEVKETSQASISLERAVSLDELAQDEMMFEQIDITLGVKLAQKQTDEITNPVSFNGDIILTLLPVETIDVHRIAYQEFEYSSDYHAFTKQEIIPEMASLSGSFSAANGDQVAATLSVNIANAAEFTVANPEYFGRHLTDVATIAINADNSELVLQTNDETYKQTYQYQPLEGGWHLSNSIDTELTNNTWRGQSDRIFKVEPNGSERIQYRAMNTNGLIPIYSGLNVQVTLQGDGLYRVKYNYLYQDDDGHYLDSQGKEVALENVTWYEELLSSQFEVRQRFGGYITTTPEKIDSVSSFYLTTSEVDWGYSRWYYIANEGGVRLKLTDKVTQFVPNSTFSVDAVLISPEFDQGLRIAIDNDGQQVELDWLDKSTELHKFVSNNSDWNFNYSFTSKQNNNETMRWIQSQTLPVANLEQPKVQIINHMFDDYYLSAQAVPVDDNNDNIIDGYAIYYLESHAINDDGQLVDSAGIVLDYQVDGWLSSQVSSLDTAFGDYLLPFNPQEDKTALDIFKASIERDAFWRVNAYVDGIGRLAYGFQNTEFNSLQVGTSAQFNPFLLAPEKIAMEDEDNFLKVNAALNVNLMLGGYHIDLDLAAQREQLQEGKLELSVEYQLPQSDKQRSFMVYYDTAQHSLTANNAEGVKLELVAIEDDTAAEIVIGKIIVGSDEAAKIVRRDNLVLIIYANGTVESL